jgi:peroxiredoxin
VWTIVNDDPDALRSLAESEGYTFPFLLDPDGATFKAYGIFNDGDRRGRIIPHPAALIIDKQGVVRYVRVDEDYRERPSVEELIKVLEGI